MRKPTHDWWPKTEQILNPKGYHTPHQIEYFTTVGKLSTRTTRLADAASRHYETDFGEGWTGWARADKGVKLKYFKFAEEVLFEGDRRRARYLAKKAKEAHSWDDMHKDSTASVTYLTRAARQLDAEWESSQALDPDVEKHAIALSWSQWDMMDPQAKEKLRTQARIDIAKRADPTRNLQPGYGPEVPNVRTRMRERIAEKDLARHDTGKATEWCDMSDTQKLKYRATADELMTNEVEAHARALAYQEGWEHREWDDGDLLSPGTHTKYRDQALIEVAQQWEDKLNA